MYRKQLEDSFTICTCIGDAITVEYEGGACGDEVVLCLWTCDSGFYAKGSTFWTRLGLAWRALWRGFGFVGDIHFDDVERLDKLIGLLEAGKQKMVKKQQEHTPFPHRSTPTVSSPSARMILKSEPPECS